VTAEKLVRIALSDDELRVLVAGVNEWLGPAYCTLEMAIAMGFGNYDELESMADRLVDSLPAMSLSDTDWTRVLLATEIAFASSAMGSGLDWSTSTGYSDEYTIRVLRQVQKKLEPVARGVLVHTIGTRPSRSF